MMQWDGKKFQIVSDWVPAPDPAFIRKLIEELGGEIRRGEQHHAAQLLVIDKARCVQLRDVRGMGRTHPSDRFD